MSLLGMAVHYEWSWPMLQGLMGLDTLQNLRF